MGGQTESSGQEEVAVETPQGTLVEEDPEAVPDGGYGWVCVACIFFLNACTWGNAASYGVFLSHYLGARTYPAATPLDYAFIGGLQFACALSLATPITYLTRTLCRGRIHPLMFFGILVQTLGYVLASFAVESPPAAGGGIWQLYLTQGCLTGLGIGLTYLPSVAVTSQWFSTRRSLANGIVSAGSGIGGVAWSFLVSFLVARASLAWALRAVGLACAGVNVVAVALVRSRNAHVQPTLRGFDARLLRRPSVVLLLAWAFASMLGYMTLLYSLSDYAKSLGGISDARASSVTAFLNLGTAVGRPAIGIVSDRYGRFEVAGLATLCCGVFVFAIWVPANSYGVLVFFAIISGTILGVFWMTVSPLCAEVVGLKDLNSLLALAWGTTVLPCTFSEVIALKIRRPGADRPYLYPQLYSGISYLVASAIMFRLWQIQRRKRPATV